MTFHEFAIPVTIAIAAFGLSIISFLKTRKQIDAEAMLTCFKILSDPEIKRYKKIIADERKKNIE